MLKLILCLCFISSSIYSKEFKYNLCICAIFQNEADYLEEWVSYHHDRGVEHFYLYNNNSQDNFRETLDFWISRNIVEIIEWPSIQQEKDWDNFIFTVQVGAYNHCINRVKGVTKWLAVIDTDEFIVPTHYHNIYDFLESEYSDVSGLCISWQCYGTSNVRLEKGESMLEKLTMKMPWNHPKNADGKLIIQPLHVTHCDNPHFFYYTDNHWQVDTHRNRADIRPKEILLDKCRLNHYWTRDLNFFENVKIPRYLKFGLPLEEIIKHANEMNAVYDPILSNASSTNATKTTSS